jgi:hypothetical protein
LTLVDFAFLLFFNPSLNVIHHHLPTAEEKRPVYIIAHKCNTFKKTNRALEQGANAIECDVWCNEEHEWWVDHNRLESLALESWLENAVILSNKYPNEFAAVIFDIKACEEIKTLRVLVKKKLPENLPIIYTVSNVKEAGVFKEVINELSVNEGISIDEEDDIAPVVNFFSEMKYPNTWCGNGLSFAIKMQQHHDFLKEAARIRDSTRIIKKTFAWTVHKKRNMRKFLIDDLSDGIMVNINGFLFKPINRALKVLERSGSLRKAIRMDKAF